MMPRIVLVLAGASLVAPTWADLPACEQDPVDECPALDLHFINAVQLECNRVANLSDCFFDEQEELPAWFYCAGSAAAMRESCTDTCAWQSLADITTCEALVTFLREVPCPL
jgi:hypothetical protein